MQLRDKLIAWQDNEITQALLDDIDDAIAELQKSLVYEENDAEIRIAQGLIRAYIDVKETILSGSFLADQEQPLTGGNEDD